MLQIQGFRVGEQLYQGPRTKVFRARRLADDQPVVLKTTASVQPSAPEISRLAAEYKLGRTLDHPAVVRFFELLQDGHQPVVVLEDVGGRSLGKVLAERDLPLVERLDIAIQITDGLAALHQGRIVHKDINPSNIVYAEETKRITLIDLGIASMLETESRRATPTTDLEGTLLYISPEQTGRMDRAIDQRTDLYSLGVTLYQLFVGDVPFRSQDPMEVVHAHIARQPIAPNVQNPEVPLVLSAIIEHLLAKSPRERYQTAEGLAHDLRRCEEQLAGGGRIEPFTLAEKDVCGRLRIPDTLYGRHREIDALLDAFARAQEGSRQLLLISGQSGVGKTALARELLGPVTERGGWFVTGRFDPQRRDRPYSGLIEAVGELLQQILTRSDDEVTAWRERLQQAVGDDGQVLIDVLPEVELLLDKQPAAILLQPAEAERRFTRVMRAFFRLLASSERPLVLLLDDLHHADAPSLRLIELLLADDEIHHLLLLATHRRGLEAAHPLELMREAVAKGPAELVQLRLAPLEVGHITRLLVDAFHSTSEVAEPLAFLLHKKTLGNPFFLNQTLHALAAERLVRFATTGGADDVRAWIWNLDDIARRDLEDDVVELLMSKMARLPASTRRMLELASCIGNTFDLGTLTVIAAERLHHVATALRPAIDAAIIRPVSGGFSQAVLHELEEGCCPLENARTIELCFVHERFRLAADQRLEDKRRRELHAMLARLLRARLEPTELEEKIFVVAAHFEAAGEEIEDEKERLDVAALHYRAGQKAQAAVAFDVARNHYRAAMDLLPEDRWQAHYDLTFETYYNYYASLILLRDVEPGSLKIGEELLENAACDEHRMRAMAPHSLRLSRAKKPERALELGLALLAEHGYDLFPRALDAELGRAADLDATEVVAAVSEMKQKVDAALGDRALSELVEQPPMTAPLALAISDLLHALLLPTYMRRRPLVPLLDGAGVLLALKHGNAPNTSMAYCGWGKAYTHTFGDVERGYEFGLVAKRLSDKFTVFRAGAYGITAAFYDWLREPLSAVLATLRDSFRIGVESGETLYAGLSAGQYPALGFAAGRNLDLLLEETRPFARFIEANMGDVGVREIHLTQRMIGALRGDRPATFLAVPTLFDTADEGRAAVDSMQRTNREGVALYALLEGQLALTWNDAERALAHFDEATTWFDAGMGQYASLDIHYYRGLAIAAVGAADAAAKLQVEHDQLARWVDGGATANFRHKLALLEAEAARLCGDSNRAGPAYEQAIEDAARAETLSDQARANEAAAHFYSERGLERVADVYLGEARYCWEKWGARAKVAELERRFPQLRRERALGSVTTSTFQSTGTTSTTDGGTSHNTTHVLDLVTVTKASQAIAGEMDLSALLAKLLSIVGENAGAQRGFLLLRKAGTLLVEAHFSGGKAERLAPAERADRCKKLSGGIALYVVRTGETVLLADASAAGRFRSDPYVSRERPRALLCTPLENQGKLLGAIYLENNLTAGAFTEKRLEVVQLLAAQAAISIENARLFSELELTNRTLEHKVTTRTADLAKKNAQLGASLASQRQMQNQLLISEKMASLGNLVAGVAHEINTPVGAMVSSVDTALRASERLRKLITDAVGEDALAGNQKLLRMLGLLDANHEVIATAGERVAEIVRTLRNFARLDEAERKMANLHEGIDSTLSLAKHRLKSGISVHKDYGELPDIYCYPNQLNQVFMNLVVNAIDAIEQARTREQRPGKISIRTGVEDEQIVLAFSDNGAGIPQEKLAEIFNPGFTTKGVGVGTGLGLSIAFNIIDKHAGSIDVASVVNEGSTFTVSLPIVDSKA